jgi:hypothetical protein
VYQKAGIRVSKQSANAKAEKLRAKSRKMSQTDLLSQLKKATEEKQKENGQVTGTFSLSL